jgi:DNA-binding NtrC family response regulator
VSVRGSDAGWHTEVRGGVATRRLHGCELSVVRGPDKGKKVSVTTQRFRVGALPGNELTLTDPAVSGHHFELLLEADGYRLRDLGSKNGTFVGDLRVRDVLLPDKAHIDIGDTRIRFRTGGADIDVPASPKLGFGPLVGGSLAMRELFAELARIAEHGSTVLITGETGTGKELVAEALVEAGPRAKKPMVVVDCSALAPNLVEGELFGYEKGAFTGAITARAGAFERADGGTVFLDEVGELPLDLQPRLLRVLERREVKRLGGPAPKKIDIHIIAATHRTLEEQVNQGTFRADLFYRLSVVNVRVPALRARPDDVEILARHFLEALPNADARVLDAATLERFRRHPWPGNVRELRNAIERLVVGSEPLGPAALDAPSSAAGAGPVDLATPFRVQKDRLVRDFEHRYAKALLEHSPGNIARAARKAGLDRMAVIKLLARHGLLEDDGE